MWEAQRAADIDVIDAGARERAAYDVELGLDGVDELGLIAPADPQDLVAVGEQATDAVRRGCRPCGSWCRSP
jgi:hypothetical protein